MISNNRRQLKIINIISDAIIIFISYLFSMWVRYEVLNGVITVDPFEEKILFAVGILAIAMAIAYQEFHSSYGAMIIVTGIGTLALMAVFFIFRVTEFSRWSLVIFFLLTSTLVILKHYLGHKMVRSNASLGYGERKVAVAGNGAPADQYRTDIRKRFPNYILEDFSFQKDIDEIVIAFEPTEYEKVPEVLAFADKEGIYVSLIPFYSEYIPAHPEIENIGKSKLINLRATPLDNIGSAFLKRAIDIVSSFIMLVILSPFLIIIGIGVKLSSPGPVFFKQERIGKDKKPFYMLKFRSMRVNDSEKTGWSTDIDPRRTKFGSFIRKYSIDELPQLLNVLIGDMSLVGPRPEIPFFVDQFKETVPLYLVRQQARPGITGWAQINGLRGDTSIKERVEYDIWYIENWSLILDIQILLATVFKGKFKNEEKIS